MTSSGWLPRAVLWGWVSLGIEGEARGEEVPGVGDDNVVEGNIALAEACQADFDNHGRRMAWWLLRVVILMGVRDAVKFRAVAVVLPAPHLERATVAAVAAAAAQSEVGPAPDRVC